ncbi:protein cueball-like [Daphnia carinata]|uniref:protein cueball-like n=1 Tax=Daphnia carinata TaxID=120202 RepID=UPI002580D351|nr:protein cueball-like [Daphnia carinata]
MQSEALVIVMAFATVTATGLKHDDLIVAVGDTLEFLTDGSMYRTLPLDSYNASKLSALAYDASTRKLFFSDRHHLYGHIFSVTLGNESHPVQDIVERNTNETVESLAYDPVRKMLLWTDWFNRSIRQVQLAKDHIHVEEKDGIEIVHFLEDDAKPRGLVFDPCMRMLYWTNVYKSRPTIERSFHDGSQREILIQTDLFVPNALDLDVLEQRLYWADNLRQDDYRTFSIERSFVNGTGRQKIYSGISQFVVSLTVGGDYVYWTDYNYKKLWYVRKDGSSKNSMMLRTYSRNPAMGVVVYRHEPLNCDLLTTPENDFEDAVDIKTKKMYIVLLNLICLVIVAMVVTLTFRFWKVTGCKQTLVSTNSKKLFAFQNFENCSSSITMSERASTQTEPVSPPSAESTGVNVLLTNERHSNTTALFKYEI